MFGIEEAENIYEYSVFLINCYHCHSLHAFAIGLDEDLGVLTVLVYLNNWLPILIKSMFFTFCSSFMAGATAPSVE